MRNSVMGTALLTLFATLSAGVAHAAGQETPATVQQVQDKDVFGKVEKLVEKVTENTTAVTNMDKTLKNAVTRKREMDGLGPNADLRNVVMTTKGMDAQIEQIAKKVEALRCAKFTNAKQKQMCKEVELSSIELIKMLRDNIANSQTRNTEIAKLLDELKLIKDPNLMESLDLQTRIQTEMALLQNEKNMVDMAIVKNEQQVRLYNQLLYASNKDNPGDPAGTRFRYVR